MSAQMFTVHEHLKEFKRRLLLTLVLFAGAFVGIFVKVKDVFALLLDKGTAIGYSLISLSPQEVITQEFRLSAVLALFVILPMALYQIWAYVMQPEKCRDKAKAAAGILLILLLFLLGAIFAFKFMIPFMLEFLYGISGELKVVDTTITVEKYVSFYVSTITIFGMVMEMPAVSAILSRVGLISPQILKKIRPFAVVTIFIISAVVTPPDVTSQLMVAIPMVAVYELCILLSKVFTKKEVRRLCEEEPNL